jgi:hypothetical protein
MAKAIRRLTKKTPASERWTKEEGERRMSELLASLPPPPSIEELARAQGIRIPQRWDDLRRWPEDDLDAWDGFDEFLEELRYGQRERVGKRRKGMTLTQPVDPEERRKEAEQADSIEPASPVNFWHSPTFEELARAQGVRPVEKMEDIMGGWPEDQLDDGFEEAIRAMRQEDLQREQGR